MMKDAMPHTDDVRDWLVTDAKLMLSDTEELLKAVGTDSKEKIASVKPRIEAGIEVRKGGASPRWNSRWKRAHGSTRAS